jgi:hypothetical protein
MKVAQISQGMRGDGVRPCLDQPRRAEDQVIRALQSPHDERARRDVPIGIPAHGIVALAGQQPRFIGAPRRRELVFSSKVSNAAEIENQDRVLRILALGA